MTYTAKDIAQMIKGTVEGDEKPGVRIVVKALEEPVRQIAENAGEEGSVIVEKVKTTGKGFNALTGEYVDMIAAGIVDPAKVTRSALQNAASVAAMVLTTESLVTDKPDPAADAAAAAAKVAPSELAKKIEAMQKQIKELSSEVESLKSKAAQAAALFLAG